MSKNNKKLSLLIPKHQNKTSKEISQMYSTQIKFNHEKEAQTLCNTHDLFATEKLMPKTSLFDNKSITAHQKPALDPNKIAEELFAHISQSNDIVSQYNYKEVQLITKISSLLSELKESNVYAHKPDSILHDFKAKAIEIDKKISELQNDNKKLKEKLALIMLDEVDTRIRREKPIYKLINKYSAVPFNSETCQKIIKKIVSPEYHQFQLSNTLEANLTEAFKDLEGDENSFQQLTIAICQEITTQNKIHKKNQDENRRSLLIKKEISSRLQQKILKIENT
jgi:hypothetical protein